LQEQLLRKSAGVRLIKIGKFWLGFCVAALFAAVTYKVDAEATKYLSLPIFQNWTLREAPLLEDLVSAGNLPPVRQRLPDPPAVLPTAAWRTLGRYGGTLHTLVGRAKDTRLLSVYGYARLVGYQPDLTLAPDLLDSVEVEDGRIFTLRLRPGHSWSDGAPFTSEDFRYYWEDVANNEELNPSGPPSLLRVEGALPQVEFPDAITVRYSWEAPNPFFLPALAGAAPLYIYRPAHYLKRFHRRYADADDLRMMAEAIQARNWAQLHNRVDSLYHFDNPDLPTLQPWVLHTMPPSDRYVAKRNPYYHRVDAEGRQLPYIDEVVLKVVAPALVPVKTSAGDSDLQGRGLHLSDYPFLKGAAVRSSVEIRRWRTARGSQVAIYPNLNASDPEWRRLIRDVRFRRALSLAINRHEINEVVYFGLGLEGGNALLPDSPLFEENFRSAWSQYDPVLAAAILDELGLTERDQRGIRLMRDGRPLEIIVETAGENTEESDILELIHDSWKAVGVGLFTKPTQREVLRRRIFLGEAKFAMWFGYENAVPTSEMSPAEFVPVRQHSFHWPKWGQYAETNGDSGEPVDMPLPRELLELYDRWQSARRDKDRDAAWRKILAIHADQIYTIGVVSQIPHPIVVSRRLENVPEVGLFNWNPGAEFGMYRLDSFWFHPDK